MEEKMPSWINFDLRLQASAANTPQWLTQSSLFNHPPQHPPPPQQQQQQQQRHPSETLTLAAAATAANNNSHNNNKQFPQGVPLRGGSQFLADLHSDTANSDLIEDDPAMAAAAAAEAETNQIWRAARIKAEILAHPLCEQLLAAHVACLRIATPVNQLSSIDNQLANFHQVVARYSLLATSNTNLTEADEKDELDQFMTHYVLLLWSFKEHLQQHMQVHVMEAVMACCELEQSLLAITGVAPGEGTGETMSDDDDEDALDDEESGGFYDLGVQDGNESTGAYGAYGPLVPTETERSLMERVRQELKVQLKNGYKDRIVDVREEILRKRRAGKLPGDTTTVLKGWWDAHSKWPYPTEDEKSRLVQETGLHLKQINNWFINQRKRNWHSNPSAPLKNKRKR